jgi:DNA end-binding protein Ku
LRRAPRDRAIIAVAQRPIWRGHLRLALVSCPVALYNARHSREALSFNMINPETGNRIRMLTVDAETGAEIRRSDLVKGYEFERDRYLLLDEADFESVKTETSSVIKVDKFIEAGSIDPVYFDSSYYMAPDGDAADDVYGVLYRAIAETGRAALSRVTMARRERPVLIAPMKGGLAVHTLLEERDLNSAAEIFGNALAHPLDRDMVDLAKQLVVRQEGKYDPADVEDRYERRLRELIAAKLKGRGIEPEEAPAIAGGNVIDLMAALKKSLAQAGEQPKPAGPPGAVKTVKPRGKAPSPGRAPGSRKNA